MDPKIVFGPLLPFIDDPLVEEIWINSPERIFIAKEGRNLLTNVILRHEEVKELVERALIWSGRRLDLSNPFVDARLPDGSRLHVAIPEVTAEHWAVNIRKHIAQNKSLQHLSEEKVMNREMADFLALAVERGMNILISGATQAGKTTLLNSLINVIPLNQRVVTIEEVFELHPKLPDLIQMQTRSENMQGVGEISLRKLVKEALRMRPNRIIVGEVREAEALDMLIALNSGLPGMGTIHSNSARNALLKLQTLPLLAGSNISHSFIVPTIASAFDLIVHIERDREGNRRVREILIISGRFEGNRIESETVWEFKANEFQQGIGYSTARAALEGNL